ncbi:hypothetical protein AMJ87_02375 [candidate division WOR_3 bacterium SM23_60]|uniref:Peptidase A2 domain-containing protein n=1 Tax=candidate division WOR_3 bacterium SM23_60 TaxID=1703780 RepID=A0A0S8GJI6_UNCW3|nr:MAG: hypothetical protein AMJ87_02375 [candidate division WOR_3 bacterium SM23_60]
MVKTQRTLIGILSALAIVSLSAVSCEPTALTSTSTSTKKYEIPFKLSRNKIILPVRVGDSRELKIILDTGMHFEGLLVYNKDLKDSITLENEIEVQVPGAGADSASTAVMADSMSFHMGAVKFTNQRIIILQSDRMAGFTSDGVTGYSLFGNYTVEVDYDKMIITLHESKEVKVDSSWEWLPMTFKDNKIPWIEAAVNINGKKEVPVSVYIDLASSEAIELLVRKAMKFDLPDELKESYLGRGLSGDIYGHEGRIASLKLGSFYLENIPTAFAPAEVRSKQEGADGIIGNNALRRFNLIFDYKNARLYIKPNEYFSEPF